MKVKDYFDIILISLHGAFPGSEGEVILLSFCADFSDKESPQHGDSSVVATMSLACLECVAIYPVFAFKEVDE